MHSKWKLEILTNFFYILEILFILKIEDFQDGVYLGRFPVASDRALGHAVAQYLWLNSKS